jgi:hypothetical protein
MRDGVLILCCHLSLQYFLCSLSFGDGVSLSPWAVISRDEAEDSASDVSMTSFHSAQETTTLNDFLQAYFQFLEVQLEHLKLVSESRKRRKARERARRKTRRTAQEHEQMPGAGKDNEESGTHQTEAAETLADQHSAQYRKEQAHELDDELDSIFQPDGE